MLRALLIVALLLQGIIPYGYMPSDDGRFTVEICSVDGLSTVDMGDGHGGEPPPCPYAMASFGHELPQPLFISLQQSYAARHAVHHDDVGFPSFIDSTHSPRAPPFA